MANKEGSEEFGVLKNTISTWMKSKEKLFSAIQETSSSTKKYVAVIVYFTKKPENTHYDALIKENTCFYAEILKFPDFKASDAWMEKWKLNGKKNSTLFL